MSNALKWKIAICVLGVLMIAGGTVYIFITRMEAGTAALTAENFDAQASDGSGELKWVRALAPRYGNCDFIYVLFPGDDDRTVQAEQTIKNSIRIIEQSGGAVDMVRLSPTDTEFVATLERLAVQKLPAVLLIAAKGQSVVIKGDITETKLMQSYFSLHNICFPSKSGCCSN